MLSALLLPSSALLTPPTPRFVSESLPPSRVEMLPDWFTTWGFAQPGPPPRKTGRAPKRGGKAKGKGKARGAASGRGGGFAPPVHEVRGDLSCASPPPDLLTVVRTHESESTEASAEELGGLCAPANPSLLPPNLPMQLSRSPFLHSSPPTNPSTHPPNHQPTYPRQPLPLHANTHEACT